VEGCGPFPPPCRKQVRREPAALSHLPAGKQVYGRAAALRASPWRTGLWRVTVSSTPSRQEDSRLRTFAPPRGKQVVKGQRLPDLPAGSSLSLQGGRALGARHAKRPQASLRPWKRRQGCLRSRQQKGGHRTGPSRGRRKRAATSGTRPWPFRLSLYAASHVHGRSHFRCRTPGALTRRAHRWW